MEDGGEFVESERASHPAAARMSAGPQPLRPSAYAGGRAGHLPLSPQGVCTIGRAPDNRVVLNDPRASRYHAHVKFQNGAYMLIDGSLDGKRSANHVFVNGEQRLE